MSIEVLAYSDSSHEAWDNFCTRAVNATLLHTRRFLSYHGKRFTDASLLLHCDGQLVGVFPAARSSEDSLTIVSHPGATYGGIVHDGWLTGMRMVSALDAIKAHYGRGGERALIYKAVPHIYASAPAQDDVYAMFRLGASRFRCDLSCAIDLSARRPPPERRRRGLKKALKAVTVSADQSLLPDFWAVLEQNLARKHDARPVHSLAEIADLMERFPNLIQLRMALLQGRVEAGVVLFNSPRVWHAQYIASSESGYDVSALDAVFAAAIQDAELAGARYFDFGTSNEDGGRTLNDGLYRFKSEFGGGGVAHDFFQLRLA